MSETNSSCHSSSVSDAFSPTEQLVLLQSDTRDGCDQLPSEMFRLIISSPPYNIGKSYEKQSSLEEYLSWQEGIITELVRLMKPGGSLCWQVGNYVSDGEVFPLDVYFYSPF